MKRHLGNSCRFLDDVYSAGDFSGARSSLSWDCLACLSPFTLVIEAMDMAAMEAGGSRVELLPSSKQYSVFSHCLNGKTRVTVICSFNCPNKQGLVL